MAPAGFYEVRDLIHRGDLIFAPVPFDPGKCTLDIIPVVWTRVISPSSDYPAVQLLYQALGDIQAAGVEQTSVLAERISLYMTASTLASSNHLIRDAIMPTVETLLENAGGVKWSERNHEVQSNVAVSPISKELKGRIQIVNPFSGPRVAAIKDPPWERLCAYLSSPISDGHSRSSEWQVRIVVAPPNCPVVDYVAHFYMAGSFDVFVGFEVKRRFESSGYSLTLTLTVSLAIFP